MHAQSTPLAQLARNFLYFCFEFSTKPFPRLRGISYIFRPRLSRRRRRAGTSPERLKSADTSAAQVDRGPTIISSHQLAKSRRVRRHVCVVFFSIPARAPPSPRGISLTRVINPPLDRLVDQRQLKKYRYRHVVYIILDRERRRSHKIPGT